MSYDFGIYDDKWSSGSSKLFHIQALFRVVQILKNNINLSELFTVHFCWIFEIAMYHLYNKSPSPFVCQLAYSRNGLTYDHEILCA